MIWHPLSAEALPDTKRSRASERIEAACEYFAACLLMPRVWMKRAYLTRASKTCRHWRGCSRVSWLAMRVRLEQLGFVEHEDTKEAA